MDFVLYFFLGFTLSFIGSMPLGIINMTVAQTSIRQGLKMGILVSAGAAFVELIQAFVALKFTWLFVENPSVESALNLIALLIFWGLGIYYIFLAKNATPHTAETERPSRMRGFLKGMAVSSVNVLVIPYWIFYGSYLTSNGWLKTENNCVLTFAVGVMVGAFALFVLYARMGQLITTRADKMTRFVNKFIGVIFIGFGIYQAMKVGGMV
ncbi:MAG: hypothetical protein D6714_06260 [Bacteroidetes bacterium]|nr:MAG: hypothetical protein D6714_06260 [Bacteroidota bacterium]